MFKLGKSTNSMETFNSVLQTFTYGKSPDLYMFGKSTINEPFSIANCNKLPEGIDHSIHYIP